MIKSFCIFILMLSFTIVYSQNSKTIEIKGSTITKTRGLNTLTKNVDDKNPVISPANNNSIINVVIDNSTGYYVDLFIDNIYKGTIAGWGKSTICLTKPFKNIYCKTSGDTKEWTKVGDFKASTSFKLQ